MTLRVSTPVGKKRRKKKPKAVAMKKTSTNSEKPTDGNPGNHSKPKRPSSSTSSFRLPSVTSLNFYRIMQKHNCLQNRRLVTTRQRQELYSLNQLMTRLEKEAFAKVDCVCL